MGQLSEYFSNNYKDSRQKLVEAAKCRNISVKKYALEPDHRDAQNAPAIDMYWIGSEEAQKKLLISSGLHGIELYAGSAIQLKALQDGMFDDLPADTAVVMIHALNPVGSINHRRVNENNVDLNRNFVDWSEPLPEEHFLTQRVQEKLKPKRWLWPLTLLQSAYYIARYGMREMQASIQQGQYTRPDGLFYGGKHDEKSNVIFRTILEKCAKKTEFLVHIDIHTGLGERGANEIIMSADERAAAFFRAKEWWGEKNVCSVSNKGKKSVSAIVSGSIHDAFNTASLANCEVTPACLEFGTQPPLKVLKALAYDNWVQHGHASKKNLEKARQQMHDAFAPKDSKWQKDVLESGLLRISQALKGLRESSKISPS